MFFQKGFESFVLQFARLGPKINNLISGPKNLGWRCHVNSLVAKKEFPFFLSLILVEPAMMRYMVLIMLKICELMTFKTLHCICYVWRLSVIVLLITKPVQLNSMGLMLNSNQKARSKTTKATNTHKKYATTT